jgi:hypothetical protein
MKYPKTIVMLCCLLGAESAVAEHAPAMPQVTADIDWWHPPEGKVVGEVAAVAVDAQDDVWVLSRPGSVPAADRERAAPPILVYAPDGHFLRGFGGPGLGYDWPTTEHSLAVDRSGHVWVGGSFRSDPGQADDMILEFTGEGCLCDRSAAGVGAAAISTRATCMRLRIFTWTMPRANSMSLTDTAIGA